MLGFLTRPLEKTKQSTKYSIYIYHNSKHGERLPKWRKASSTGSIKRAIKHAKLLHRKHKNKEIEIRKHFFCTHSKKFIGKTIKIYTPRNQTWLNLITALQLIKHTQRIIRN